MSGFGELGLSVNDLRVLSAGQVPSESSIERIGAGLGENTDSVRALLTDVASTIRFENEKAWMDRTSSGF